MASASNPITFTIAVICEGEPASGAAVQVAYLDPGMAGANGQTLELLTADAAGRCVAQASGPGRASLYADYAGLTGSIHGAPIHDGAEFTIEIEDELPDD